MKKNLNLSWSLQFGIAILSAFVVFLTQPLFSAEDVLTIPPLTVVTFPSSECAADDWVAKPETLDYDKTQQLAIQSEKDGYISKALTLWERVLDRTTCTEEQRSIARTHIKTLRPRVQKNTDPKKAKGWSVLVVIYKEVKAEIKNADGNVTNYHKIFTESNLTTIGKELAGFRDLVFEWSDGLVLLNFDVVFVKEPIKNISRNNFPIGPREIGTEYKKHSASKKYDTVIAYVKCRGDEGANINVPFTAAIYGRLHELNGAGYMMVPWATNYPYKNELFGEMELHEWLHQVDDIVHHYLGYPRGTTRSPDDGRGVGDNRPNGEEEYKRPKDCRTWSYFYKHLMTEHLTRQIWSELTTKNIPKDEKPGAKIKITK
ncbi:MAG: hypothetical protein LBT09_01600 [Planctomycetaceae bacterium]|jgi:hypothetical protein|nr:hypothetical protein [Planctomycetaceae bacterium]